MKYKLIDCGDQLKYEQMGEYTIIRPCPQALWKPFKTDWTQYDSRFSKIKSEKGEWRASKDLSEKEGVKRNRLGSGLPGKWLVENANGIQFNVEPNEYGNIGVFPEHWEYTEQLKEAFDKEHMVLNLFTYSGSNCIELAKEGYKITAVDSSKNALGLYTSNLELNDISRDGHRIILEDCLKFIQKEARRENTYKSIMADVPSFGRGTKGEVFAIEDQLVEFLEACRDILDDRGGVLALTYHSPRFTPMLIKQLLEQMFRGKTVEVDEILIHGESGVKLTSGIFCLVK